jgi:ParB family chromosome partitioning protein
MEQNQTKSPFPKKNQQNCNPQNQIKSLGINLLKPYPNHPFRLYEGKRLADMVSSIQEFGVIAPVIVRYIDIDIYQILSGHNRVNAAKIAGLDAVPVFVKYNISDEEANLIVTESNLQQRSFSDLSHSDNIRSERAICLSQHYEAIKCQGKRTDLINELETLINTSSQLGTKLRTDEKIARENGLSNNIVARYIRISSLIPALLSYIDTGKIAFLTAYQLSFIENENIQTQIAEYVQNGYKIDMKKAVLLREHYQNNSLTDETIWQIISYENVPERKPFKLRAEIIDGFFDAEQGKNEIEQIIISALQLYFTSFQQENEQ